MKRSNLSEFEAKQRMNSQMPQNLKINKSDYVIQNNSTTENLYIQVDNILKSLQLI